MADFNPYAAPARSPQSDPIAVDPDEGRGVWRDGGVVVMSRYARLPSRCVLCNAPATTRLKRTLSWYPAAVYLLLPFYLLPYLIVAFIVRKTATIEIPLCARHRAQRSREIGVAWMIALGGFALPPALAFLSRNQGWIEDEELLIALTYGGTVFLVAGIVYGVRRAQVVSAREITKTHVWLKKISPAYLATLTPLPEPGFEF